MTDASLYRVARDNGVPFARPFVPTAGQVRTPELVLRYLEWGEPGSPLVVLLHGFAQTAHTWDLVALSMADDYHVVCLDQRGHGDSEWAPDGDYSLSAFQRDLDEAMRHFGDDPRTLIGLSMGGRNSYVYAARRPERTRALVIVDTGPVALPSGRTRIRNFVTLPDRLGSYEEFVERVHRYLPDRSVERIRQALVHNVRQTADGRWTWKYDVVLRDPNRPRPGLTPEQSWSYLNAVQCPTLIVRGAKSDILAVETASEMVNKIPNCRLVEVADAGHLVPGDNPRGFVQAIRPWLDALHFGAAS